MKDMFIFGEVMNRIEVQNKQGSFTSVLKLSRILIRFLRLMEGEKGRETERQKQTLPGKEDE